MKECLALEKKYQFDSFNADIAFEIGKYGVEYCKANDLQICIDIYAFDKILFHYSSDACSPNNEDFLMKKRNAVLYFQHSTKFLNIKNKDDQSVLQSKYGLSLDKYCITTGGFPIGIKGSSVVGAICVSGLAPEEDHNVVMEMLKWYFGN